MQRGARGLGWPHISGKLLSAGLIERLWKRPTLSWQLWCRLGFCPWSSLTIASKHPGPNGQFFSLLKTKTILQFHQPRFTTHLFLKLSVTIYHPPFSWAQLDDWQCHSFASVLLSMLGWCPPYAILWGVSPALYCGLRLRGYWKCGDGTQ